MLSAQPHIDDLLATERVRPLRRVEYDWMVGQGFFSQERVELLDGFIVEMTPQGVRHAGPVRRLTHLLIKALGDRAYVRIQLPFAASEVSEPEPDVAVVPPGDEDAAHPSSALLAIEVADSSLKKDQLVKTRIYASAGVPEYWVVNVANDTIEIRTEPAEGAYRHLRIARAGEAIRLQAFPDVEIAVSDVLR